MADWTAMARIASRYNAQEYLLSQGVAFPKIGNETASANYIPSGSKLVVRDTRDNLDMIDSLVDAATGVAPTQVDIQTKFLDIQQNNLQELGFDWLLGPSVSVVESTVAVADLLIPSTVLNTHLALLMVS